MGPCTGIWLCSSIRTISGCKERKIGFSSSTKWRKEKTFWVWWNAYLQLLWIIMSHAFTLELTTFEQQVCSTKIGCANALLLGTNSRKKRNVDTLDSAHQPKKAVQLWQWLDWTTTERCTLLLLNFLNLRVVGNRPIQDTFQKSQGKFFLSFLYTLFLYFLRPEKL